MTGPRIRPPVPVPLHASRGPRWVTVFNGARDAYQAAVALQEAGVLEGLVTDWYSPLDRSWFRRGASLLPARVRDGLARRFAPDLPSSRVRSLPLEVLRQARGPSALEGVDKRLGQAAGEWARRSGAGLLAYSYHADAAFAALGAGGGPRAVFQVQAHPASFQRMLREEAQRFPASAGSLLREPELSDSPERVRAMGRASGQADVCIVPSAYAGETLVENGVDPARVQVVPYGVDLEAFRPAWAPAPSLFRVLFVGQLSRRKGLHYLLDAWRRLALPDAELLLVGRGIVDEALLAEYRGCFRVEMNVGSRARMRELYQQSAVFCMPSLVESFGLVYLEAMACGTPVIGTRNTGAADVVRDGRDGFLVEIRDADALAERLRWCYHHRDALAGMGTEARARAEEFSWARFRERLVAALPGAPG